MLQSGLPRTAAQRTAAWFYLWSLVLLALLVLPVGQALAGQLKGVEGITASNGQQRIRLDVTGHVANPNVFTLSNPSRVVIDLPGTQVASNNTLAHPSGRWVKDVRYGRIKNGSLRVVMDVASMPHTSSPQVVQQSGALRLIFNRQSSKSRTATAGPGRHKRDIVVVLDPGHGGKDSGTIGPDGTYEKTVVLAIAKRAAADINRKPGFKAYLTRSGDYFLSLPERVVFARKHQADFFASIHANATKSSSPHGTMVFALSEHGASSTMASWMAQKENHSSMLNDASGVDLSNKSVQVRRTLIDLSLGSKEERSSVAASNLITSIAQVNHMFSRHAEKANFAVLRSPDIPAVLIETDFLSNTHARANLKSSAFQARMGQAIADGIERYFKLHPPNRPTTE